MGRQGAASSCVSATPMTRTWSRISAESHHGYSQNPTGRIFHGTFEELGTLINWWERRDEINRAGADEGRPSVSPSGHELTCTRRMRLMPQTRTIIQDRLPVRRAERQRQGKARDWYREPASTSDFDCEIDEFVTIGERSGSTSTRTRSAHGGGKTRSDPTSTGRSAIASPTMRRSRAPTITRPTRAQAARDQQRRHVGAAAHRRGAREDPVRERVRAARDVKINTDYRGGMSIDVYDRRNEDRTSTRRGRDRGADARPRPLPLQAAARPVRLPALGRAVDESIEANEYEFDEEGARI
jgi:hypothetical protein